MRVQQLLLERAAAKRESTPSFLAARPAAPPTALTLRTISNLTPPSTDGRAGTLADPVLQSLQQSLQEVAEENGLTSDPAEKPATEKAQTVTADESESG